jgi:hypothetical protein
MMNDTLRQINKILLVIFITFLIWVWADLALEEKVEGIPATIEVKEMPSQDIWVTLDSKTRLEVRLTITGPHARIADLQRRLKPGGEPLALAFDARQLGLTKPGKRTTDLTPFFQGRPELKNLGLTVTAADPSRAEVTVLALEPKPLPIKLIDTDGLEILDREKVEPDQITIPVPANWTGEKLIAFVQLSTASKELARQNPIERTPYIELAPGMKKDADKTVKIKLRSEQPLKSKAISPVIGYAFSATIQGQYRVEINDEDIAKVMAGFPYSATDAAEAAYKAVPYHLVLMIEDKDKAATGPITRRLIYNFPLDSVEKDEIKPLAAAPEVRFKLVPVPAPGAPAAAPPLSAQ